MGSHPESVGDTGYANRSTNLQQQRSSFKTEDALQIPLRGVFLTSHRMNLA